MAGKCETCSEHVLDCMCYKETREEQTDVLNSTKFAFHAFFWDVIEFYKSKKNLSKYDSMKFVENWVESNFED